LFQAAINRFLLETNDDPKPFVRTADPDKIIAAVKRGHQNVRFAPLVARVLGTLTSPELKEKKPTADGRESRNTRADQRGGCATACGARRNRGRLRKRL